MSIKELKEKIKAFAENNEQLIIPALIVLVAFGSFGMGRLSKIEELKQPIRVESLSATVVESAPEGILAPIEANIPIEGAALVGSKKGSKYHYPWCSGAQRIKEENKIVFQNTKDARAKGYTPAANCKGLE